jgi:glycosyltransferase involved in cell wall biosynthesis
VALQVATLVDVERRKLLAESARVSGAWRRTMTNLTSRLDHAALRRVDAVLVENPWMESLARSLSVAGRPLVRYAPPGVDIVRFRPVAPGETTPFDRPYILGVGRFADPRKNVDLMLEAFSRMAPAGRPLLVLAGSEFPPDIVSRAERLGVARDLHLVVRPSIEELARLYRHAMCFALSSDEEGFGVVVIEAMSSGVPVVATRCGGPEGIVADGSDGYLVHRDDADGMASRLTTLASDPELRAGMGRRARSTVEHRYSEEVAGRAYLDVYERLLAANLSGVKRAVLGDEGAVLRDGAVLHRRN